MLSARVNELGAVLLERRDSIESEFVVRVDECGRAWNNHGGDGFVGFEEFFDV